MGKSTILGAILAASRPENCTNENNGSLAESIKSIKESLKYADYLNGKLKDSIQGKYNKEDDDDDDESDDNDSNNKNGIESDESMEDDNKNKDEGNSKENEESKKSKSD